MEKQTETQILSPTATNIMRCASVLRAGGLVAFPTETVYALGAVATDAQAVKRLFEVKERPADKALIVAVAKKSDIDGVAKNIPDRARALIDRFMPGALTLVLDKADCIPSEVTAGGSSVAVRIPNNDIALKIIELTGKPVVVPSANTSDKPSPTLAAHVKDDLDGKIECVVDGGASEIGIESTIVDVRTEPSTILRVGGVSVSDIESVIGKVLFIRESANSSKYNPAAEVFFSAYYDDMTTTICAKYDELVSMGRNVIVLCLDGDADKFGDRKVLTVGASYSDYAHNIFAALRQADAEHYDAVIAEGVKPEGMGLSLIARLVKISNGQII